MGDLFEKLKTYKAGLSAKSQGPFYFAKVDVQSAYDTIPQNALLDLVNSLPTEYQYRISRHAEVKPSVNYREDALDGLASKPSWKWASRARGFDDRQNLREHLTTNPVPGNKNSVFVEKVITQDYKATDLLRLLSEHVQCNLVKIEDKYYRQKQGITQGSVLSSMLCNYFYADLELTHLAFLQSEESLLLRLIDDSLLITTNPEHAKRFLQIMLEGKPAYGVEVNPDKSLANFEAMVDGKKVPRLVGQKLFPFIGCLIDTRSLDISKDRERQRDMREFILRRY